MRYRLGTQLPGLSVPSLQHERSIQPNRHARTLSKGQDPNGSPVSALVGSPFRTCELGCKRSLDRHLPDIWPVGEFFFYELR